MAFSLFDILLYLLSNLAICAVLAPIGLSDAFILQIHSIKRMLWYHLAQFGPESGYIFLNVSPVNGVLQRKNRACRT